MTKISNGLVVCGNVIPGTERIQRVEGSWWHFGERGTRARAPLVDLYGGHWTAGEAGGEKRAGAHGPRVVEVMKKRRGKSGKLMKVGIPFIIGAPADPATPATIWQTADIGTTATIHVGRGDVNGRSEAVEIVSAGMPGPLDSRKRTRVTEDLLGRDVTMLDFFEGQYEALVWLGGLLASLPKSIGFAIPKRVPGDKNGNVLTRRMTVREMRGWSGAFEHFQVPGTTKVDAGGLFLRALARSGWSVVPI